jgi:DNA-binding response OmpR family regulator
VPPTKTQAAKIIIVEDDPAYRQALETHLGQAGFHVLPFEDGLRVLDYLDGGGAADAMVTDLQLPPGSPNGLSLAHLVRRRRPNLPTVMTTAFHDMAVYVDGRWGVLMHKDRGADALLAALLQQGLAPPGRADDCVDSQSLMESDGLI